MNNFNLPLTREKTTCYHCGENCDEEIIYFDGKEFCCTGCKLVYDLLNEKNLCTYYKLNQSPGVTPGHYAEQYTYLDDPAISGKLIHFKNDKQVRITFYIPGIHCSSCIWLLENLNRLNPAISNSSVNFLKKEVTLTYSENEIMLSSVAGILSSIGYAPLISLNDLEHKSKKEKDYSGVIKIGIAGFCFGNIMMLSFPEYFSFGNFYDQQNLKPFFGYINILLSLPVFFYCASGFFDSAWKSIRQRRLNIDAPIALAIAITFLRSLYEIITGSGAGYMDSLSGIVFFMLVGRHFQAMTYDTLSFERDYKSYFPIAVSVKKNNQNVSVPVNKLQIGDRLFIRNQELLPADARLLNEFTHVDYSFVTGEAVPVRKTRGELIYAGARQLGGAIELEVTKEVSQSYLTQLWNTDAYSVKQKYAHETFIDRINKYFTSAVLIIALSSFGFWIFKDSDKAINALTAILIIACPCGLLLSSTFCNAGMLRIFSRHKLYLKNASVIEDLAQTDTIVFDKTGTITHGSEVEYVGKKTGSHILELVAALCSQSSHPLSRKIHGRYSGKTVYPVSHFSETQGMGIKGSIDGHFIIAGSAYFVNGKIENSSTDSSTKVFLSVDGELCGYFAIHNTYRKGLERTLKQLGKNFELILLSGDHNAEKKHLEKMFNGNVLLFDQTPEDKLRYIKQLQSQGKYVLMIGDGLNDSGALKQSDVGIAVSDDTNTFSPACDGIMDGSSFAKLESFILYSKSGKRIITASFVVSLFYNITGLFFAVQGTLSPVIAAILMPASSISIVLLTTFGGIMAGRRIVSCGKS